MSLSATPRPRCARPRLPPRRAPGGRTPRPRADRHDHHRRGCRSLSATRPSQRAEPTSMSDRGLSGRLAGIFHQKIHISGTSCMVDKDVDLHEVSGVAVPAAPTGNGTGKDARPAGPAPPADPRDTPAPTCCTYPGAPGTHRDDNNPTPSPTPCVVLAVQCRCCVTVSKAKAADPGARPDEPARPDRHAP